FVTDLTKTSVPRANDDRAASTRTTTGTTTTIRDRLSARSKPCSSRAGPCPVPGVPAPVAPGWDDPSLLLPVGDGPPPWRGGSALPQWPPSLPSGTRPG